MSGLRSVRRGWIVAAWIAWPVGLLLMSVLAVYLWLRAQGTVWIDFNIGWQQPPDTAAWAATLLPLALLGAALLGPPLLLTYLWRRSRRSSDHDRPT